uniref:GH16 domain-containing protein n=1 Tax=Moniliophthora roreri TaxID=221103 RepID=A0A0W0FM02_MONRR
MVTGALVLDSIKQITEPVLFLESPPSHRHAPSVNTLFIIPQSPDGYQTRSPKVQKVLNKMGSHSYDRLFAQLKASASDKYSLPPDPHAWGNDLSAVDPDDHLHTPDPKRDMKNDGGGTIFSARGIENLGCLFLLMTGLMSLFADYPIVLYLTTDHAETFGVNATGQVATMPGNWGLIDLDTPQEAYTFPSYEDGTELQLIFSDEFNTDGRTFYPGDDPYWEAVDLHYWGTNNLEWYDPAALTTVNGSLQITLSKKKTHGMDYEGGMMSTWNKFCFTGGLIVSSVTLPGTHNVLGLWPAIWTMGNLGRAGFGASLDGTWPYSYDACDVGTVKNQTMNGLPATSRKNGPTSDEALSFLPGQRLSRCTCPGESHPGPIHRDGSYVGRAAPEIDIFEAQVSDGVGHVSQSCQWAPFNDEHKWFNTSDTYDIYDDTITELNTYLGGPYQQATSCVSKTEQKCYQLDDNCFSVFGFEYRPGYDEGYITWISDGKKVWAMNGKATAADPKAEISARPIPQEPMYIIANLGISYNFGGVDFEHLIFPAIMNVDWIRVYQRKDEINIGCDPKDFPTKAYIEEYLESYINPNLTTWVDGYKQPWPKNKFLGEC